MEYLQDNQPVSSSGCLATLERGLWLEDRNLLLPWGASRLHLTGSCRPDRQRRTHDWDALFWNSTRLFTGLDVAVVEVTLYPFGWMDSVWCWLNADPTAAGAERAFERARRHLERSLGQPVQVSNGTVCTPGRSVHWDWNLMHARLWLRIPEPDEDDQGQPEAPAAVLHIARRPEGCCKV